MTSFFGLLFLCLLTFTSVLWIPMLLSMFRPSQKVLIARTISLMENPGSWVFDTYTAKHTSSLEIWTSNFYPHFYKPCRLDLRFTDALRLRRALATLRSRKLHNHFTK